MSIARASATISDLGRRNIGIMATILATIASIATSDYEVPHSGHLAVGDQKVTLTTETPVQRFRYRVASFDGRFTLNSTVVARDAISPSVSVSAVASDEHRVERVESQFGSETAHSMQLSKTLQVRCEGAIPCSIELEVAVTAKVLTLDAAFGDLTVTLEDDQPGDEGERYFSLEALP